MCGRQRLGRGDVEAGGGDVAASQRRHQVVLRHDAAATRVDEHRRSPHASERRRVEHARRLRSQRAAHHHEVGVAQQDVEVDALGAQIAGRRRLVSAAVEEASDAERAQTTRHGGADTTEADHPDGAAGQAAATQPEVGSARRPVARPYRRHTYNSPRGRFHEAPAPYYNLV